ncbi:MAG TPA: hypothetical protein DCZ95_11910 [Verrucomicrobia bacterium]|nr:MAG: hypothetical protein A2X46_13955 [Lentisphaerae bacterium GWF2_57_35]HBA84790.1 hypothetical protein [Verrucomicrobiota bacterium]
MHSTFKRAFLNRVGSLYLRKVYQDHIGFLRNARVTQERLFKQVQRQLAGTALGTDIQVERHASFKEFVKSFGPQPYEFYEPYVKRVLQGEPRVLYKDDTEYFLVTSGNSGFNSKVIPCNTGLKQIIGKFQQKVLSAIIPECESFKLTSDRFAYGSRTQGEYMNGIPKDYISGVLTSLIPGAFKEYVVPFMDTLGETCWETKLSNIIAQSRHRDIRLISGLPAYLLHVLKAMMDKMNISNLREIWPHLEVCVYSGTTVHPYETTLNQLAGVELKYFGAYVSTESPLGFEMPALSTQKRHMFFVPDMVLYTFHDLNGPDAAPLTLDELRAGGEYLVNLGTPNGLIHYAIKDYIKVSDVQPFVQFELQGRYGSAINIAAEKVSETEIGKTVHLLQERVPLKVEHVFVYPSDDTDAPRYEWVIAADTTFTADELSEHIDQALMNISADYKEARLDTKVLAGPQVQVISPQLIKRYFQSRQGAGQFKMKSAFSDKRAFLSYASHCNYEPKGGPASPCPQRFA